MESNLLQEAVSGDSKALSLLINKYKDIAFNIAIGIVKNREDAKDIVQDSFLKVLEGIHKFRNESKFSTWLYRIVYNESLGFAKRRRATEDINNYAIHEVENPDNLEADEYQVLYKVIEQLNETDQSLIRLFYLGEKSVKEIHEITNLSISNIKVILHRARKKMLDRLEYETKR